jgi:drug/metabolite transporter (DMT)-like permease
MQFLDNPISALALSSGLSVLIFLIFKWISKKQVALAPAIVWNYITCVGAGVLFLWGNPVFTPNSMQKPGFFPIISLGILFMITFLLMGMATAKSGAGLSAVASKMSVSIPVLLALIFFFEEISIWGYTGIALALLAVYIISYQPHVGKSFDRSLIWVFIGSGLVDTGMNLVKHADYIHWNNLQFAVLTFTGAAITGLIYLSLKREIKTLLNLHSFLWGFILGLVNLFSIFAIYNALDVYASKTAVFFTLNNVTVVVLSFILGVSLGEKFTKRSLLGLALAVIAIILLG